MLALDPDARVFYEGTGGGIAIPIWPSPFVSLATIVKSEEDLERIPTSTDLGTAELLFREDYFDPVTRIRRGRLYSRGDGSQPQICSAQAHPALPNDHRSVGQGGLIRKQLFRFHDRPAKLEAQQAPHSETVILGVKRAMTRWRMIGVEAISTGEDLITLKATSNMGVLPEIAVEKVPEAAKGRIQQAVQNLVDTAYRAGPESVVDRCRDLAAVVLGNYFVDVDSNSTQKDLAKLGALAGEQRRFILEQCAKLLALMHARTKPSEQARRNVEAPTEEDASLALECARLVLREVGWARV